jgi:signal-transduction protein with cAMP-binding, CBS, and nucleotidyltransferase domain
VAADRNPATTRLDEVMTANPDTLPPDAPAVDALHLMREHNYRHLPVVKDGEVLGIVSIRDLYAAVQAQLEQDIQDRDAFIYGQSYSVGT